MSQPEPAKFPPITMRAAGTRIKKPRPTPIIPRPNLTSVNGSLLRFARYTHKAANNGASVTTKIEFNDWNVVAPKDQPKIVRSVLRLANSVNVDPACSKHPQKIAAAKNKIMITI